MKIAASVLITLLCASAAHAQNWKGFYVGGAIGAAMQRDDADETIEFDTNLDATFGDTIRTAAGGDAFSPGFCGGISTAATVQGGCTEDEDGIDFGGRVGYDWSMGSMLVGAIVEFSRPDASDGASAFSTTPAFYAFDRSLNGLAGFRARVGGGSERVVVYGTGGLAWGWVDQTFMSSNAVNTFVAVNQDDDGSSQGAMGYQAGGGVEFLLGSRWSMFGEYLFTSLDNREESTIRAQGPAPATNPFILTNTSGSDLRRTDRFDLHLLRVGLNVRF